METMKSDIEWVGIDWAEALKYLRINLTHYRDRQPEVEHLLPERMFKKGPKPGITSENALSGDRGLEDKWIQRVKVDNLTSAEQARVMECCLEIAIVKLDC